MFYFDTIDLIGRKKKNKESGLHEDDDFTYEESGDLLTVIFKSPSAESIIIENWDSKTKKWLGIELGGNDIEVSITEEASASEGNSGEQRNLVSHTTTFIQNGDEYTINDVWFRKDTKDVLYEFDTEVSAEIAAMPELKGSGRVKNLSHAMSEDATLQTKVQTLLDSSQIDIVNNASYNKCLLRVM